ncbi:MAG: glycosyltransferase, partial [Kocuria sp.]|nr:glycosyltransferase [Kocuria sp.]
MSFQPQVWPDRPPVRSDVTVAVILDDFSARAFHYEWNQIALSRDGWKSELAAQPVDFLFVESAWHGNGDDWQYQLTGTSGVKEPFKEL